jgi:sugar phosphate isomerase/epimerase
MTGLQLPEDATTGVGLETIRSFSVHQTSTYRWSLEEDLAGYVRAGVGGIGLYRPKVAEFEDDVAIDLVRSSGLAVTSLSWIGPFTGSDGARQAEALFDAGEALRFAAAVGAGTVAVVSGGTWPHIPSNAQRLLTEALTQLCAQAADLDLRLALHPFSSESAKSKTFLNSLGATLSAIDAAQRPQNLGLILDLQELGREPELVEQIPSIVDLVHVVKLARTSNAGVRSAKVSPPSRRSSKR